MTTHRILLHITSISLLMALLAVGRLLAQSSTPPPNIVDHNITTTTFTFDDGADPSVWFSGSYAIAPQAEGGYGMAIALDDAPVTLNRPLLDGETLAVTIRRGVGRAGVRLVGETAAYTVWIETSGIAVLERDGAEQGRVPVAGDAQRVTLTYASGTLSASVGAYAFPPISGGTAFASLRAEFVVQGGNGQGSTFDDVTVPLPPGLMNNVASPSPSQVTATPSPTRRPTAQFTPTIIPWSPAAAGMTPSQRGLNAGVSALSAATPPPANVNLLTNPSFTNGLTGWLTAFYFATTYNTGLLASQSSAPGYGTAYQDISGAFAPGMPLVWQVDLGHIYDDMTNRVQLVLHDGDWTNARVCTFDRAGAGFAARTYVMSATVPGNWSRVYAMVWTLDGVGTFRVTRGDLRYVPNAVVPNGLLCGQVAPTVTPTPSSTNTPTNTPTHTRTFTPTITPTDTLTNTTTNTPSPIPTFTPTSTPTRPSPPGTYDLLYMTYPVNTNSSVILDYGALPMANLTIPHAAYPIWSRDGGEIGFLSWANVAAPQICRQDVTIPGAAPICELPQAFVPRVPGSMWDPQWNSASDRVYVQINETGTRADLVLETRNGWTHNLTENLASSYHVMPAWHPTEAWLAYVVVAPPSGGSMLPTVSVHYVDVSDPASPVHYQVVGGENAVLPLWSTGELLAFSFPSGEYLVLDPAHVQRLTTAQTQTQSTLLGYGAVWSPEGVRVAHIAFGANAFTVEARSESEDVYITLGPGVGVKVHPYYARTTAVRRLELRRFALDILACVPFELTAGQVLASCPAHLRANPPSSALDGFRMIWEFAYQQDPGNHTVRSIVDDLTAVFLNLEGSWVVLQAWLADNTYIDGGQYEGAGHSHPFVLQADADGRIPGLNRHYTLGITPSGRIPSTDPQTGQLRHFWAYFATFVYGNGLLGEVGDWVHECLDNQGTIGDARLTTAAFELAQIAINYQNTPQIVGQLVYQHLSAPRPLTTGGNLAYWYYENATSTNCSALAVAEWRDRYGFIPTLTPSPTYVPPL